MSDSLEHFAAAIVEAEATAGRTTADATGAQDRLTRIDGRIKVLAAERAAIAARRAVGDHRADDGANLALIEVDSENLGELHTQAEAEAHAAGLARHHAIAALAAARSAFKAEEARAAIAQLDDHAAHLLALLAETCRQRTDAAAALPVDRQNFGAVTARLAGLDSVMVADLAAIRRHAPFNSVRYAEQPSWKPSDALYNQAWRHYAGDGRFV